MERPKGDMREQAEAEADRLLAEYELLISNPAHVRNLLAVAWLTGHGEGTGHVLELLRADLEREEGGAE